MEKGGSLMEGPVPGGGGMSNPPPPDQDGTYPDTPPPEYETIIDIPDMADLPPPPQYTPPGLEGVPGLGSDLPQYSTTPQVTEGVPPPLPALAYVDFLPRCIQPGDALRPPSFENFKTLMTIVNDWLQKNNHYRVIRCESIERKVRKEGVLETETTIYHTSAFGDTEYVCGIRLWLTPSTTNQAPQQLWYMNVVPKCKPIAVPIAMYGMYGAPVYGAPVYGVGMMRHGMMAFPSFEDLDTVVDKLNKRLREEPIPGHILTVESVEVKYGGGFSMESCDPDRGYWRVKGSSNTLYLTTLRVFFVMGRPQVQEIGIEDFTADCISNPGTALGTPQFEPFGKVVEKAGRWIYNQQGTHVTNVQAVNLKLDRNIFKGRYQIDSKRMDFSSGYFQALFMRVLRVAYVKKPPGGAPITLTTRVFSPVRLGSRNSETTSQTVQRLNAWLNCTGAKVIGADTLHFEFTPESRKAVNTEKSSFTLASSQGHYWMSVIRVYLDGVYEEPPAHILPPVPGYVDVAAESQCCVIL